eukprot:GHVS01058380.1.p1 GENE.GHVS01058380.1~~GHVS01058380.1.p1  ORF type:complete len:277 (-),score=32.21 GHVS01058380.1:287-1117(-)
MWLTSPLLFLLLSFLLCCLSVSADFSDDDDNEELPIQSKGLLLLYPPGTHLDTCAVFKFPSKEPTLSYVDVVFNQLSRNPDCMLTGDKQRLHILKDIKFRDLKAVVTLVAMEGDDGNQRVGQFVQFMPVAGEKGESPLTKKQKEFFRNFDLNLEVMGEVIGVGGPKPSAIIEKAMENFNNKLPYIAPGHMTDLRRIFNIGKSCKAGETEPTGGSQRRQPLQKTEPRHQQTISSAFSLLRIHSTCSSDVLSQFFSLLLSSPSLLAIGSFILPFVLSV